MLHPIIQPYTIIQEEVKDRGGGSVMDECYQHSYCMKIKKQNKRESF